MLGRDSQENRAQNRQGDRPRQSQVDGEGGCERNDNQGAVGKRMPETTHSIRSYDQPVCLARPLPQLSVQ